MNHVSFLRFTYIYVGKWHWYRFYTANVLCLLYIKVANLFFIFSYHMSIITFANVKKEKQFNRTRIDCECPVKDTTWYNIWLWRWKFQNVLISCMQKWPAAVKHNRRNHI